MDCCEYERKFEIVKDLLITNCRKMISVNYDGLFREWLDDETDRVFGLEYQNIFGAQFEDYMTDALRLHLMNSGKNLIYAISSLVSIKNTNLDELMHFISKMVSRQLEGINNDYDTCSWIKIE